MKFDCPACGSSDLTHRLVGDSRKWDTLGGDSSEAYVTTILNCVDCHQDWFFLVTNDGEVRYESVIHEIHEELKGQYSAIDPENGEWLTSEQ
jgi:hypothetical protein